MLQRLPDKLLPSSRIAVGFVAALLFVLGIIQIAQGFIDTHNYRDQFIHIVKQKTGKTIAIKGKVSVSLLPTPTIYLPDVALRDPENANAVPSLTVEMIRLDVPLSALFSDQPRVTAISLQEPVLEVDRLHDNLIHWDWLNTKLLKALTSDSSAAPPSLSISGGKIMYHDDRNGNAVTFEKLSADIALGSHITAKGTVSTFGHAIDFTLTTAGLPENNIPTPFTIQLHSKKDALRLDGNMSFAADIPKVTGKFDLALENALTWVNAAPADSDKNTDKKTDAANAPLPLSLSGDWAEEGLSIDMSNLKLDGLNSKGDGNIALHWRQWQPFLVCAMNFSTLDYNAWQKLSSTSASDKEATASYYGATEVSNPFPQDLEADLTINAAQVAYGAQIWKNMALSAALSNAMLTVNQFNIELPGDSRLSMFGIISQGTTHSGLRFEGSMETSGASLRQALTAFNESAAGLPDIGFGAFSARSNIFVSAQQVRLSEADVKLNDLALHGGLVAYFDAHPRLEADIKLKDINFDYFRNVLRDKQPLAGEAAGALQWQPGKNFNWLKSLQTSIDFKLSVDGFTFMERKGSNATLRVFAKQGEFGLYDIRLTYPQEAMSGNITFNVSSDVPVVNATLNADNINIGYFMSNPPAAAPVTAPVAQSKIWPDTLIDTSWLQGYNGDFDLTIGKLTYGNSIFDKFRFQAHLENNVLALKTCTFNYWQGSFSILGSLFGGEVPGSSISFTLYALDLHDMLKDLIHRENITGKSSFSGTLTTSGVNFTSWISQADLKLVMAARGVDVTGLNLQGVMDATAVSRTAADVFNNVNHALVNGASELSVDGNINVKGGVMRTPGITLKSGTTLGDLTGEVRLLPWTMDLSTLFQFPALSSETIPTLMVQLSGPVETPDLKTDTSSLEAYVAKRIVIK